MKKFLLLVFTSLFLLHLVGCSHVEDTNGPLDHTLTTLTDADFLKGYTSGVSSMSVSKTVNEMTTISVKKFSGIDIMEKKIRASGKDLEIKTDTGLVSGNLRICVVRDSKEIVAEIDVNGHDEILIENASGVYTIVIGGESAEFAFTYTYRLTDRPE